MKEKTLILDNYDSFTYNLVHMLKEVGLGEFEVRRNDQIELSEVDNFDRILLSPGPGIPMEAGIMPELVKAYAESKNILGVCLGHQCIGEVFGAKLKNLDRVVHGKAMTTRLTDVEELLFQGLSAEVQTGRYHSWVVEEEGFPECLRITAVDEKGVIMGLSHRNFNVKGLQFHPESVLTPEGALILKNWIEL